MRPKRSTAALAAATACASSVTSRRTLNRLSCSPSTLVTAREVATTKSPRLSAAWARSRPRPLEAPVMNQTLWIRSAARLGALMTAPRRCERLTLYQPVVHGCLAWRRKHVARTAPAATQRRWRFPRSARVPPARSAHREGYRAGLDHPLHRVVVRKLTDVAAAVLHDVHFVAVVDCLYARKGDTHFGPESREHDLLPTGRLDRGHEVLVVPSVHG